MKKFEIITGSIAFITLILKLLYVPSAALITMISGMLMAFFYAYLSFAFFNNIQLNAVFRKTSYTGISAIKIIGTIGLGISLALTTIGVIFTFLSFPGAKINLIIGELGLIIVAIICIIKTTKEKSAFYLNALNRVIIVGGLGLIILFLPYNTLVKLKFRNHPNYVNALIKANENPNDENLLRNVELEREKMNEEIEK